MKSKSITNLLFPLAFGITNFCMAQIPNYGFENWSTIKNYSEPVNWSSLNSTTSRFNDFTCKKMGNTTVGYSVSLWSKTINGKVVPGIIVSGKIDTTTYKAISGFAYTGRPSELKGSRQFMGGENDNGFIAAYLTKWDTTNSRRDTIGFAFEELKGMSHTWSDFKIPFKYNSILKPDSCVIVLSSSGKTPKPYSFLYIDNLSFDNKITSFDIIEPSQINVYPNPATTEIFISFVSGSASLNELKEIILVDMLGKIVLTLLPAYNNSEFRINTESIPKGIYILRANTKYNVFSKKLIIE